MAQTILFGDTDCDGWGALVEPPTHFSPKVGQELRLTIPFRKRPGVVVVKRASIHK